MASRDEVQCVAVDFQYYGWRRVLAELRRRGWVVNHKRVHRMMRENNLLCPRRKRFVVVTTESNHNRRLSEPGDRSGTERPKPLWVAHITYNWLETEFVHFALVLDANSRRVIGWALYRIWKVTRRSLCYGWPCAHDRATAASRTIPIAASLAVQIVALPSESPP